MKKTLILLAGYPGTGKTYMCNKLLEQEKDFQVISQDDMKEQLWDEFGFDQHGRKDGFWRIKAGRFTMSR